MNSKLILDHATASGIVRAGHAKADEIGVAVCVAVVDDGGHPVSLGRMDGAPFVCSQVSLNKAGTAAGNGISTKALADAVVGDPALLAGLASQPGAAVFGGGEPLIVDGRVVGAVGVAGGASPQDLQIAVAASEGFDASSVTTSP